MTDRARLILLNGPPAAGKSTIAQRYVDDHPIALNLDIDTIRALLGGWLDQQEESGLQARRLALAMARTHLSEGHDVIVPQLVARAEFVEELAAVAQETGAQFVELFVLVSKDESRRRVARRENPSVAGRFNATKLVARNGGQAALDPQYERLMAFVTSRPDAVIIDSAEGQIGLTYAAVMSAVESL